MRETTGAALRQGLFISAFVAMTSIASAQQASTQLPGYDCEEKPIQSGTISFRGQSASFLVGYRWGRGVLTLESGQQFPFSARGLKIIESGVRSGEIEGVVYGLKDLADFIGHYEGRPGGLVLAKGKGDLTLVNSQCVFIVARHKSKGITLSLPASQKISIQFSSD